MLKPDEVFTLQLPLEPTNVYAERGKAESDLQKILRRGLIPIVYGEYGVGKTSMVRYNLKKKEDLGALVYIESVDGKSLSDVLKRILERVGYEVTTQRVTRQDSSLSSEVSSELTAGLTWIKAKLKATVSGSSSEGEALTRELIVTSPSDSTIIDLSERKGLALVLDEMHRASQSFRTELATFIKAYANRSCKEFSITLLGTTSDATALVRLDPGIDRLLQEVYLPIMSFEESVALVFEGMKRLELTIPDVLVNKTAKISGGSPTILQFLCLEMAEEAFSSSRRITQDSLQNAVREFVRTRAARLNHNYATSIETLGKKRYRKQILHSMAESPEEMVTLDYIRKKVSEYLGKDVPSTSLSRPLRELKSSAFGPVLKDVQRVGSEDRVSNLTAFADPALKSFIRMRILGEQEGISFS